MDSLYIVPPFIKPVKRISLILPTKVCLVCCVCVCVSVGQSICLSVCYNKGHGIFRNKITGVYLMFCLLSILSKSSKIYFISSLVFTLFGQFFWHYTATQAGILYATVSIESIHLCAGILTLGGSSSSSKNQSALVFIQNKQTHKGLIFKSCTF